MDERSEQTQKKAKTHGKSTLQEAVKKNVKNDDREKYEARIRFQFTYKGEKGGKRHYGEQMKDVLYSMMMVFKRFNKETQLMTWRKDKEMKDLSGEEIKLLANDQIMNYVDLNTTEEVLKNGKKYYMNGIRIKSYDKANVIVKKWDIEKYKLKDKDSLLASIACKEAEMQTPDNAYAIGYMMGTTEKGDYTTLNKEISAITGVNTEASFQMVNQRGVSRRIWQLAKEKAEIKFPNPYSKEHRRLKFQYSPSALVIYVSREDDIETATEKLFEKFGSTTEGQWAEAPDGSRTRFVPIIHANYLCATKLILRHVNTHCNSVSSTILS